MSMTATWALPHDLRRLVPTKGTREDDDEEDKLILKILAVSQKQAKLLRSSKAKGLQPKGSTSSLHSIATMGRASSAGQGALSRTMSHADVGVPCYPPQSISRRANQARLLSWRNGPKNGVLRVDVDLAMGLLAADLNGLSDPYVVVQTTGQQRRTRIIRKTLEPTWDESFEFHGALNDFLSSPLRLQVFDWDELGMDDVLGECKVMLQPELRLQKPGEEHMYEYFERLSPQGKVAFRVTWLPDVDAVSEPPATPEGLPNGRATPTNMPVLLPSKFDYIQSFYGREKRPPSAKLFSRSTYGVPRF